jgi:aspartyl-tRNA(Asn)/glutamyl-tRNA(Gln) amidotransferase subunit A
MLGNPMKRKLNELSATELINLLNQRAISNEEIINDIFEKIESNESSVRAFITLREKKALIREAKLVDNRRAKGEKIGLLSGLPIAIKDNICTQDTITTCASKLLENFTPAYDATAVIKIKKSDGLILGKTNMDEFAMGSSTENSAFQITRNPHNLNYVPGGTSGGSAAAIASNEAILALGSDTGGSVRQPASYCGIVGLKPTYGRVSRYGLIAYASSLDQIGTLTKTVEDTKLLFSIISGFDSSDSTSYKHSFTENNGKSIPCRIGVPKEYFVEGIDPEVNEACQKTITALEKLGYEIIPISLPHTKYAVSVYYIIASAEMSSNLARFDGVRFGARFNKPNGTLKDMIVMSRTKGFGQEVKRRIILGTFVLSGGYYDAYYSNANKVRFLIRNDFTEAFKACDLILSPVAPTPAFKIGEKTSDPMKMYLTDIFSVIANLTGLPAISIPSGFSKEGLPLSIQLTGNAFEENLLLRVAKEVEGLTA